MSNPVKGIPLGAKSTVPVRARIEGVKLLLEARLLLQEASTSHIGDLYSDSSVAPALFNVRVPQYISRGKGANVWLPHLNASTHVTILIWCTRPTLDNSKCVCMRKTGADNSVVHFRASHTCGPFRENARVSISASFVADRRCVYVQYNPLGGPR